MEPAGGAVDGAELDRIGTVPPAFRTRSRAPPGLVALDCSAASLSRAERSHPRMSLIAEEISSAFCRICNCTDSVLSMVEYSQRRTPLDHLAADVAVVQHSTKEQCNCSVFLLFSKSLSFVSSKAEKRVFQWNKRA